MHSKYVLVIDQGTTGTTVIFFNSEDTAVSKASKELRATFLAGLAVGVWKNAVQCTRQWVNYQ